MGKETMRIFTRRIILQNPMGTKSEALRIKTPSGVGSKCPLEAKPALFCCGERQTMKNLGHNLQNIRKIARLTDGKEFAARHK